MHIKGNRTVRYSKLYFLKGTLLGIVSLVTKVLGFFQLTVWFLYISKPGRLLVIGSQTGNNLLTPNVLSYCLTCRTNWAARDLEEQTTGSLGI